MTKPLVKTEKHSPDTAKRKKPSLALREDGSRILDIEIDGDFSRISNDTISKSVALGLIGQIASLGSHGKRVDEIASNFALGFVDAMQPKDAAEALLLGQMAATHQATMMMARRFNHVKTLPNRIQQSAHLISLREAMQRKWTRSNGIAAKGNRLCGLSA